MLVTGEKGGQLKLNYRRNLGLVKFHGRWWACPNVCTEIIFYRNVKPRIYSYPRTDFVLR